MPVTQVVLDRVRYRISRLHPSQSLSRTAALATVAIIAADHAGLATSELATHGVAAGRLIATITKLTVMPSSAPDSIATLAATEATADGAHPAGWVQFEAGDTDIGAPVAVSSSGMATTSAAILAAAPAATSLRATFTPATTAYLAPASTTTAAQAGETTGGTGGSITITFTVPPPGTGTGGTTPPAGAFTVTVLPDSVTLQDVGQSDVATGVLQTITVSETRSWAPGWSVRGQESDFTGERGAHPLTILGTALGWAPTGTLARFD